jgi:quercetin dioxygenase-like cupin family protein
MVKAGKCCKKERAMKRAMLALVASCVFATAASVEEAVTPTPQYPVSEQDATAVAPKNYKIELENDLVRVVRVTYGPHEKTPMHEHQGNAAVIVVLQGGGRMRQMNADGTILDGKTEIAGSVRFVAAHAPFKHASENVTDYPLETIRIELKNPPCASKSGP